MQLPNPFSKTKEISPQDEKYLACHVEESFVELAVWQVDGDKTSIFKKGTPKEWVDLESLSDAIEFGLEELNEAIDDVAKVLFGLPEHWIEADDVSKEYKEVLKKVTQKMSLDPIGFVVSEEAVFQHIGRQPNAASQMLFINATISDVKLALVERGNQLQAEKFGRSENISDDVLEGLARLQEKPYPPIMNLYSLSLTDEKLEELGNELAGFEWTKDEVFAQLPEIQIISRDIFMEAICLTGGLEVMKAMGVIKTHEAAQPVEPKPEAKPVEAVLVAPEPELAIEVEEVDSEEVEEESNVQPVKKGFALPFFSSKRADNTAPKSKKKITPVHIAAAVLGVFLLGITALYGFSATQTKVNVTAYLQKEPIFSDVKITLDPSIDSTDAQNNILKAAVKKKEVKDSEELSTTGEKIIGEKATGTVTILNKTENDKSFSKGTEITASGKKFILEDDVTVASSSAKENANGKTLDYGKADVKVTAADIGADFNVGKDTEFSIANFSTDTYAARSTDEFKGGSSREIQAVAKADHDKLRESLRKSLLKKAEEEYKSGAGENEFVVLTGKSKILKEEFSAKVDDETNSVKLTLTMEVEAFSYNADDLKPIAQENLQSQVPSGGTLLEESVSILSKQSESSTTSAKIELDARLSADYTPATNQDQWKTEISGKQADQAKKILEDKKEIQKVEFSFSPAFIQKVFNSLPRSANRITIETKVE